VAFGNFFGNLIFLFSFAISSQVYAVAAVQGQIASRADRNEPYLAMMGRLNLFPDRSISHRAVSEIFPDISLCTFLRV
jgi:hypothetical protein